jgi:hypothetical protein
MARIRGNLSKPCFYQLSARTKLEIMGYWKHRIAPTFLQGYCRSMIHESYFKISKRGLIQEVKPKVIWN